MAFLVAQIVGSRTKEGIFHIDDLQIFLVHEDVGSMEVAVEQNFRKSKYPRYQKRIGNVLKQAERVLEKM